MLDQPRHRLERGAIARPADRRARGRRPRGRSGRFHAHVASQRPGRVLTAWRRIRPDDQGAAGARSRQGSVRPLHRQAGRPSKMLKGPSNLGGEASDVTILFSDIRELHRDGRDDDAAAGRRVPQRVLLRDGRRGVRAGRRARQVPRRRPDGGVRIVRRSARSRAARGAGRAADEGAARARSTASARSPASRRSRSASASTPTR